MFRANFSTRCARDPGRTINCPARTVLSRRGVAGCTLARDCTARGARWRRSAAGPCSLLSSRLEIFAARTTIRTRGRRVTTRFVVTARVYTRGTHAAKSLVPVATTTNAKTRRGRLAHGERGYVTDYAQGSGNVTRLIGSELRHSGVPVPVPAARWRDARARPKNGRRTEM